MTFTQQCPGTDPGFPVAGGANPPGAATYNFANFSKNKNCMKLRTFWAMGGPLDPPLVSINIYRLDSINSKQ